jgi:hypothetical protein
MDFARAPSRDASNHVFVISKMILLMTSDDGLHARLSSTFGADDVLMRCEPGSIPPRSVAGDLSMAILDCGSLPPDTVRASLNEFRRDMGNAIRCVAIARTSNAPKIQIVTTDHQEVVEAIFPGVDSVADLLRAHLNDTTRTAAAAVVLELLEELLPVPTHEILCIVFGSAFGVSSVKQLEAYFDEDRTTFAKRLRKLTHWTPDRIIEIAQASHAVMLLRDLRLHPKAVSAIVKYSRKGPLDDLLERKFGMKAFEIQNDAHSEPALAWLERQLRQRLNARDGHLTPRVSNPQV